MLQFWPPRCMDANRHTATDGRANDARADDGGHASGAMDGRHVLRLTRHGGDRRKQKPDDDAAGQLVLDALLRGGDRRQLITSLATRDVSIWSARLAVKFTRDCLSFSRAPFAHDAREALSRNVDIALLTELDS